VDIGEGVMTIIPVMGMALIAPDKTANRRSGGAVLLLDSTIFASLPIGVIAQPRSPAVIDWVQPVFPHVAELAETAGLATPDASVTEAHLRRYIDENRNTLGAGWITSTLESVSMADSSK
jgi:hypothetical protein